MTTLFKLIITLLGALSFQFGYGQPELHATYNKGLRYMKSGNFNDAISAYTEVLKTATDTSLIKNCYIYRALSYNELGKFNFALGDLDSAIKVDPKDLLTHLDRGKTKLYLGLEEEAIKDYIFILTVDSVGKQAIPALFHLAKIAYSQNEFGKSIKYYDRLILLTPNISELYFNRGCAKGMLMESEDAIKDYDKAIELKPDYTEAYANRGVSKINLLTTKGNVKPTKEQTTDGCADLKKAKKLGDKTVDDMIFIYCNKK
jgi:tetratricopeptide (TPR) repeat protein